MNRSRFLFICMFVGAVFAGPAGTAEFPPELHSGPMLGCMTDTSVRCWVRTKTAAPVRLQVSTTRTMENPLSSNTVTTSADSSGEYYIGVMEVTGLKPRTTYYYQVDLDGGIAPVTPTPSFTTFPAQDERAVIRIGFGGGAANPSEDSRPEYQKIWQTIKSCNLDAFLLLGDNVYFDKHPGWSGPHDVETRIAAYLERHANPLFRNLISTTPIFAIWDDHDFADNDCVGSPAHDRPAWKPKSWQLFKENFNNPSYGGNGKNGVKGCWFKFSIGQVDFFMLDGRYYRVPKDGTMLGPVQKQWLKESLRQSEGLFKVIVSPVPWHDAAKNSDDTWRGFAGEREEIFSYIRDHHITGVLSLTADRHRSDAVINHIPDYYDLYEFESSRLTNKHYHKPISHPDWLFSYNKDRMFGLVTFDLTEDEPRVSYQIVRMDGQTVPPPCQVTIKGSKLRVPSFSASKGKVSEKGP